MISDLRDLILPRDPAFHEARRGLHARRDDLRSLSEDPDGIDYARWCATYGPFDEPEVLGHLSYPPIPPAEIRATGSCGASDEKYLLSGLQDFEVFTEVLEEFGREPLTAKRRLLDFACGSGRMTRWFAIAAPDAELVGVDVHRPSIEWCREHLPGRYLVGPARPPLELEDDSFDVIVVNSLFTHLTVDASRAWIEELARVCTPDGLMLITIVGAKGLLYAIRSPEYRAVSGTSVERAREALADLWREGVVHFEFRDELLRAGLHGTAHDYGMTYTTPKFIEESWRGAAEIVGWVPACIQSLQDLVVARTAKR